MTFIEVLAMCQAHNYTCWESHLFPSLLTGEAAYSKGRDHRSPGGITWDAEAWTLSSPGLSQGGGEFRKGCSEKGRPWIGSNMPRLSLPTLVPFFLIRQSESNIFRLQTNPYVHLT